MTNRCLSASQQEVPSFLHTLPFFGGIGTNKDQLAPSRVLIVTHILSYFQLQTVCLLHRYISGAKGRLLLLFRAEKRPPYPLSCILLESISSGLKASLVSFPCRDLRQCCQSVCITAQYDITLSNLWILHCLVIFLIQSGHLLKKFIELGTLGILQPTPHSVPWGGLPDAGASRNQSPGQLSLYLWGSHCCSQPCPSTFPKRLAAPGCSHLTLGNPQLQDPPSPSSSSC